MTPTADILDTHDSDAAVCELDLRQFGGVRAFEGPIATVRCLDDNLLLKQRLAEPGDRRVLVIDGGGSLYRALLGDQVAGLARASGWAGLVVNGAVRDVAGLLEIEVGIKAIGPSPRKPTKQGDGDLDVAVSFGGVTFRPGAMLYSDDDGVVVLDR